MRLALEGLGVVQPQRTIVDALADQIQLIEAEDALRDSLEEVDVLLHTYHSLESIHQAIKQCGVTQSIVQLYGENFSSMESDQTDGAEKEVEEKKQGLFARIWKTIKELWEKFVDWLKKWFTAAGRVKQGLIRMKCASKELKYPFSAKTISSSTMTAIDKTIDEITVNIWTDSGANKLTLKKRYDDHKSAVEKELSNEKSTEIRSSSDVTTLCDVHLNFFEKMEKMQKKFDSLLMTTRLDNIEAMAHGFDLNEEIDCFKDAIAFVKSIVGFTTTSSRNLLDAINKAQK